MRHIRGLATTAEAIQQVFNVPVKTQCRPGVCPGPGLHTTSSYMRRLSTTNIHSATYKPFTERSGSVPQRRQIDLSQFGLQKQVDRPPRDEEIQYRDVVTRSPDGKLSEVRTLQSVLHERKKDENGRVSQFVQVVADPDRSQGRPYAIVAYFDKKQLKERQQATKKREKEMATREKSLEFSWSVGDHDLSYRMDKVQNFLQKGKRVEILFGSPGWRVMKKAISSDEAESLLGKIREAALEVEGVQVIQEFKGTLLRDGGMIFQGPSKKSQKKVEAHEEQEENLEKANTNGE